MFDVTIDNIEPDRVTKYRIIRDGVPATYSLVLDLWCRDTAFRCYFTALLADSPFSAYRWETPALTTKTAAQPFEFVLLNSPEFTSRQTDSNTYNGYYTDDDSDNGIVTFANLRGDATLVVPSPRTSDDAYGHLAAFVRLAPESQLDAFWRVIGATVKSQITDNPIWLSTAGGGVAWLHVRLDARPKYYGYSQYSQRPDGPTHRDCVGPSGL
jgi:Family of unknown function (DUF6940)